MTSFLDRLKEKVIIFDGAMGTSIHKYDLTLDDYHGKENCSEILVDTRPDVITEIHAGYLSSGCDVIETNTFGASSVVLAEFNLAERAYEINKKAAQLAKSVAADFSKTKNGMPRFVSGSIGPTTKLPTLGHIAFGALKDSYYEQVSGLVDGGVDLLQFETGQDLLQAKAAIMAMLEYFKKIGRKLPIIAQITIEAPPISTMLVGSDISAALATLQPFPIDVIGMNCATGPKEMIDSVHYLCQNTNLAVSVLPNAGLPENIGGKTVYKLTPNELAESLNYFVHEIGVNIIGGCCGTTAEHLKKVCEIVGEVSPKKRSVQKIPAISSLYTACPLNIDIPPLIIGERANTNGSRKFKQLLEKDDLDGMVAIARSQEKEGAHLLDVCTAYVGRDEIKDMSLFVRRLNTDVQVPLVVDTTEYPVLEHTLQLITGRSIVNSINLEDGEEKMLRKVDLITKYGAAAIALTIDESGMAKDANKKLEIAKRICDLSIKAGMKAEDLIFDCLTFTLSTGNEDDRQLGFETLKGIKLIKENLPGVKTSLGVSNVSFGFDPQIRRILNSVFLHYCLEYGLDMAIIDASKIIPLYKIDETEREFHRKLIFDERSAAYDPLFSMLAFYRESANDVKEIAKTRVPADVKEALKQRVIDGNRVGLEEDLKKALEKFKPLDIINDFLLDGMKVVGELFGAGKMQLPFVLQSAETMKAAVAYLEPFMEKTGGSNRGTLVLATVKGDVHDIGKNLVDIILTNNGYKVINLGIKQPIENIISAAKEHNADCIGMSGLLVKSTVIMKENLEILNQHGIITPVILGGAALTRRYVEEDCRAVYKGQLFYGQDAFFDLRMMEEITKNQGKEKEPPIQIKPVVTSKTPKLEKNVTTDKKQSIISVERSDIARKVPIPKVPFWGSKVIDDIDLEKIFPYLNETVLFKGQWQIRQREMSNDEYKDLINSKFRPVLANLKQECIEKKLLVPKVVYGYFPCQSKGNDLIVYQEDQKTEWLRFHFPRQEHSRHLCISDFFASVDEGQTDVLPMQIVTMGRKASQHSEQLFKSNHYADYLYFHGLSVESAEALAEFTHKHIRNELGFSAEDKKDIKQMLNQGFRGTRYSFGYPACPNLEDQAKLFALLKPERIEVTLTEEFQLVPEQSTSAIIVAHPEAKYFNIKRNLDI